MSRNRDMETRTLLDELRSFDKGSLFNLGHPLLNRVTESFVKTAGRNSAVAGAITGMALVLTPDGSSREQTVQSAITGAVISTTANLLAGIFEEALTRPN